MVDMSALIGSLRRFGLVGPAYEVVGPAPASPTGEARMRIRLVESGEDVEYPLAAILSDPSED